jgi:hypothetical protein
MGLFGLTRVFGFIGHHAVLSLDSKGNLAVKVMIASPGSKDSGSIDERVYVTLSLFQFRRLMRFASAGDKLGMSVQLSNIVLEAEEGKTTKGSFLSAFMRDRYDDQGKMVSSGFNVIWNRAKEKQEIPAGFTLRDKDAHVFNDLDDALNSFGLLEAKAETVVDKINDGVYAKDDLPF